MLKNNNHLIIRRMALQSLKSNRRKSILLFLAIFLSSFMLFSIFSCGITYSHMNSIQNMRLNGADFDAIMYGMTPEQEETLNNNPKVKKTGVIGISGYIEETEADKTVEAGLIYADDVYWNEMMAPLREWETGNYPETDREVMATKSVLGECGLDDLQVGDTFSAVYQDGNGQSHTMEFTISGMWDGFGVKDAFYVSKSFYEKSGYQLSDVASGRCFVQFDKVFFTQKQQNDIIEEMKLGKQQSFFFTGTAATSIPIFLGMAGIAVITCFCAYLLIYNILYLSVSGNVRYYGLLQTIGMTGKQILSLITRQMLVLGTGGIMAGILMGNGVSFILLPAVIKAMGIRTSKAGNVVISFHPAVFFLTIAITGLTIFIGSRKPARLAAEISPIEAVRYRPSSGSKKLRKTEKGKLIWRIAKEQITKDRKKSAVIILSLSVGLSVFLCLTTLIESQGARTIVSNFVDMDLVIKNATLRKEDSKKWKQILTPDIISEIKSNDRIKEIHPMISTQIMIPWEPDFAELWMEEFYEKWMRETYDNVKEEYQKYPENFGSFMIGIDDEDFEYLKDTVKTEVNKEDFVRGKTCILYRNGLEFKDTDLIGKNVTCAEYENEKHTRTFQIAGLTDETYYTGSLIGCPPIMIVSDRAVKTFAQKPYTVKASIRYKKEYDKNAEKEIHSIMQKSPDADDFSYDSKLEELKYVEKAQGNMMEIGMGIALILAFIGIMNYINTVIGNIQNRQAELATLESIGMMDKQIDSMLVLEGGIYALCSLALTGTVGMGITYLIFQSMNYRAVLFFVPILPITVMCVFITILCLIIPVFTRKALSNREPLIQRMRKIE